MIRPPFDYRRRASSWPDRDAEIPTYVYRCFDADGVLLYVGCSVSPVVRVQNHQLSSWWGDRIATTRFLVFPNREKALDKEREAIYAERPICNVKGRWYRLDPRDDWTEADYLNLRHAVVQAANGVVGPSTTRLLAQIDAELAERQAA